MDHRAAVYQTYAGFKSWQAAETHGDESTFGIELVRAGVKCPAKILEIGFGDGCFLDWASRQGYSITGVELIEKLVTHARARGHDVFCGTIQSVLDPAHNRYDLIVAFDVFEHLTILELLELLRFAKTILASGGRILARFPNGGSPFSAPYQTGDVTHMTVLSGEGLRQIAHAVGMKVIGIHNAARSRKGGSRHGWLKKYIGYLVRDMIELAVGMIYFGQRMPLDPNLTVVIAECAS
jgi:2-polyprenyl-3-methyl-5-hydroxy-6-metoxy-1,4-benzoquinol methylase